MKMFIELDYKNDIAPSFKMIWKVKHIKAWYLT